MGMYDSIFMECKCPYCGETSRMEFQTKDLGRTLYSYEPGNSVSEFTEIFPASTPDNVVRRPLQHLNVNGQCKSAKCQEIADKLWIILQGRPSGFGAIFGAKLKLVNGIISNELFDIDPNDRCTEEYVNAHKNVWEGIYKPRI